MADAITRMSRGYASGIGASFDPEECRDLMNELSGSKARIAELEAALVWSVRYAAEYYKGEVMWLSEREPFHIWDSALSNGTDADLIRIALEVAKETAK